jgi:23S rRNA (uracil1939-C5)-methyltransferase
MSAGDVYNLKLESIAAGGDALGRFNGKPVFVQGGAPDEAALCRITEERSSWARGELLEVVQPSPVRVESACPYYGKCGGCNLQHISYEAQLEAKVNILKEAFTRIGGFSPPQIEVISCPPFEYRNRMQFHCLRQKALGDDSPKFGLKGRKSGEIIPVKDCPVAVQGIRQILQNGGKTITLPPEKDRFTIFSHEDILLNEGGAERGKISILGKDLMADAGVFFQSNVCMLEKLILKLQKTAEGADRNLPMADLYCGVGTFAVFLGDMFAKTILAEENKKAVSIARENLRGKDIEFFALTDSEWKGNLLKKKEFGFVLVDPPRAGLAASAAQALAQDGHRLLSYVSCEPSALARDAKVLINGGYKPEELTLFDFYPQTAHIETLALFVKG